MKVFLVIAYLFGPGQVTEWRPQQSYVQCIGNMQHWKREAPPGRYAFCLTFEPLATA